jgi:hypothetical protein
MYCPNKQELKEDKENIGLTKFKKNKVTTIKKHLVCFIRKKIPMNQS